MRKFNNIATWTKEPFKVELLEQEYEVDNNKYIVKVSTSSWENKYEFDSLQEAEAHAAYEIKFCRSVLKL